MTEQAKTNWGSISTLGSQIYQDRLNLEIREHLKPSIFPRWVKPRKPLTRRERIGLWFSDWKGRFVLAWRALRGEDLE